MGPGVRGKVLVRRVGSGGGEGRRFSAVGDRRFGDWASGVRRILLEIFGEAPRISLLIFGGCSEVAPAVSAVGGRWFGGRGPEEACEWGVPLTSPPPWNAASRRIDRIKVAEALASRKGRELNVAAAMRRGFPGYFR